MSEKPKKDDYADVLKRLGWARSQFVLKGPYWGSLALQTPNRLDTEGTVLPMPTAGTDGLSIYWNPEFVRKLSSKELVAIYAHEVQHIAFLHPFRRGVRNPILWNVAADFIVNDLLQQNGFEMPASALQMPKALESASTEQLYETLRKKTRKQSCPMPDLLGPKGPEKEGEGSAKAREAQAKLRVRQALNAAKMAGQMPAGLERWLEPLLGRPQIPFEEVLARWAQDICREELCWTRPNRRFLEDGVCMPSRWSKKAKFALAVDTSGSMDDEALRAALREVEWAVAYAGGELLVLWADHAVYAQQAVAGHLKPKGGGGTSYAPVMDYLNKESEEDFRGLIYITDGYCGDFGKEPPCEVLWVVTTDVGFEPPFGEVVRVRL